MSWRLWKRRRTGPTPTPSGFGAYAVRLLREGSPPRISDASSLVDLFNGHRELGELLDQAEAGWLQILMPTSAMADAEAMVNAGRSGWDPILLTPGVQSLPLTEHTAIEIGSWPGSLAARHVVHEAAAVRGVVVTRSPGAYDGLRVSLLVV